MLLGKHQTLTLKQLQKWAAASIKGQDDFEVTVKELLEIIQRSMRFDAAWVLKFDTHSLNIVDIHLQNFSQRAFSLYLDFFYTKAPIPTIGQIRNEGFVSKRCSDLIEHDTWIDNLFFREVIHPLGLPFFLLGACIDSQRKYVGLIVLWRSQGRQDFSVRDCFFLEKASVHCATVLNQTQNLTEVRERPEIVRLVTQRSDPGVFVLGREDKILYMNQEAKHILTIVKSGKGKLSRTEEERFFARLQQLKAKILEGHFLFRHSPIPSPPCEVFTFRGTSFSCRGIPLESKGQKEGLAMILVETVRETGSSSPSLKEEVSGFTARERVIAKFIAQGHTNKEIASELEIGVHTVKDHIKNIMRKLKTSTRSGIVGKMMEK